MCKALEGRTAQNQLWDPGACISSLTDQPHLLDFALYAALKGGRGSHFITDRGILEGPKGSWFSALQLVTLARSPCLKVLLLYKMGS